MREGRCPKLPCVRLECICPDWASRVEARVCRYDLGEQKSAGRLAFPICETHCETFVENCLIFTLNKPRCVIGVCPANGNTVTPVVPGMLVMCRLYEADARMRSAPDRTVWPDEPSCSSLTACFGAKLAPPRHASPAGCPLILFLLYSQFKQCGSSSVGRAQPCQG